MAAELVVSQGKLGIGETEKLSTLTVTAKASFNLSGTVAKTSGSPTLTGTSTAFLNRIGIGDRITVPGGATETRTVIAIASNASLTVDSNFENTASGQTATCLPSTARFTDSNGNTQVIVSDEGNVGVGTSVPPFPNEVGPGPLLHLHAPTDTPWLQMFSNDDSGLTEAFGVRIRTDAGLKSLDFFHIDDAGVATSTLSIAKIGVGLSPAIIGGLFMSGTIVESDFTLDPNNNTMFCDAGSPGITITLPPVEGDRYYHFFKIAGAGAVTIAPNGSDLINGANASVTISTQWSGILITGYEFGWVATAMPAL